MPNTLEDLFELFPDLPRYRRASLEERRRAVADSVVRTRARARANIVKQKAAAEAVKTRVEQRQRRGRQAPPVHSGPLPGRSPSRS